MCGHRAQLLVPGSRSFLLRPDRTFVPAWICTEDKRASHLQAKGWRCYPSQNTGPAIAASAGTAPPPLLKTRKVQLHAYMTASSLLVLFDD